MDKLYIVMPAYNEEANIRTVVEQWHPVVEQIGEDSRVVIVDDGSKDATYRVLEELRATYPQLIGLTKKNSGHGSTCLYAYRYAIEQGADYVFQTDSDGQTDPAEFTSFWEQRADYDFLIGARKERQDGFSRVVVTKVLKLVVMFIFGRVIEDANTPFRLMRASKLALLLKEIPQDFFLANVLVSVLAVSENMKTRWIPITFKPRQGGVNSINLKRIMKIGIKSVKDLRKVKKDIRNKQKS
ncbi:MULTISPECIES: glycosyltransferase family 2 protein [Culturomica]|jgi:dolichol-phosphate mannosyltransferase|uniref:glycosyltransferase family 2 protein n=2 Tax=Odoribacteraceae TaxID=1853231 RepID=UPI000E55AC35|nr:MULTISPECIES: glycosyltransferase family 2 protein [Odoribacteraceae]RHV94191.1 glycosyltransferase family 2 protein [Odoribacter sp. OF09-27XD]HBO26616.1 glycosyltransferase [Culturomica sp.]